MPNVASISGPRITIHVNHSHNSRGIPICRKAAIRPSSISGSEGDTDIKRELLHSVQGVVFRPQTQAIIILSRQ